MYDLKYDPEELTNIALKPSMKVNIDPEMGTEGLFCVTVETDV